MLPRPLLQAQFPDVHLGMKIIVTVLLFCNVKLHRLSDFICVKKESRRYLLDLQVTFRYLNFLYERTVNIRIV